MFLNYIIFMCFHVFNFFFVRKQKIRNKRVLYFTFGLYVGIRLSILQFELNHVFPKQICSIYNFHSILPHVKCKYVCLQCVLPSAVPYSPVFPPVILLEWVYTLSSALTFLCVTLEPSTGVHLNHPGLEVHAQVCFKYIMA